MIGPNNPRHALNQSDANLAPIMTWSSAFSRALGFLLFFTLRFEWLFRVFSFLLIGCCNHFSFDLMTLNRKALWLHRWLSVHPFYSLKAVEWWALNSRTVKYAMWNGCECLGGYFYLELTRSLRIRYGITKKRNADFFCVFNAIRILHLK